MDSTMDSENTTEELEAGVESLIQRRMETDIAAHRIRPTNDERKKAKRDLEAESAVMGRHKDALQTIIRERRAATQSIPPLKPDEVEEFNQAMETLNQQIKADEAFDVLVAAARGINAAATRMEELTNVV